MSKYEYLYDGIIRRHKDIILLKGKKGTFPNDVYCEILNNRVKMLEEQLDTSLFILESFLEEKEELIESLEKQTSFFDKIKDCFNSTRKEQIKNRIRVLDDKIAEYKNTCTRQRQIIDEASRKREEYDEKSKVDRKIRNEIEKLENEIINICTVIILSELLNKKCGRRINVDALKNVVNIIGIDKYKEIYISAGGYEINRPIKKHKKGKNKLV